MMVEIDFPHTIIKQNQNDYQNEQDQPLAGEWVQQDFYLVNTVGHSSPNDFPLNVYQANHPHKQG